MKSPAFQFYPADFLADENVAMMTNQEIGCYIKLMCYCWREGSIPKEISKIAKLCGEDSLAMAELWRSISQCFTLAIADPSRLLHHRLEAERVKQENFRKERSESGKKGAEAKWAAASREDSSAIAQPIAEHIANDSSSFASLSLTSSSSSSSKSKSKPTVANAPPFLLPDWVNSEDWNLWLKTRKGKKMISEQMAAQIKKLDRWRSAGLDYGKALSDAAASGWLGLVEPVPRGGAPPTNQKQANRDNYDRQAREAREKYGKDEPRDITAESSRID